MGVVERDGMDAWEGDSTHNCVKYDVIYDQWSFLPLFIYNIKFDF